MAIIYKKLAIRIKDIRNVLGITQTDIAKRAKMSRETIANIEIGRQQVSLEQIELLASALGTTPKGLLKGIWL